MFREEKQPKKSSGFSGGVSSWAAHNTFLCMSTELGLPKPGGKGVGRMTSLEDIMQSPMIENSIECCVYPCLQDQNDQFEMLLWEGKHFGTLTAEKWVCFFCVFQAQLQVSDYALENPCSGRTNVRLHEEMLGAASISRLLGQPRKGLVQTRVQDRVSWGFRWCSQGFI